MDRDGDEIWIFGCYVLEQLELRHLRADVCGKTHGEGTGCGDGNDVGVDADDRGVLVPEREEGTGCYHYSFHIGLNSTESM